MYIYIYICMCVCIYIYIYSIVPLRNTMDRALYLPMELVFLKYAPGSGRILKQPGSHPKSIRRTPSVRIQTLPESRIAKFRI